MQSYIDPQLFYPDVDAEAAFAILNGAAISSFAEKLPPKRMGLHDSPLGFLWAFDKLCVNHRQSVSLESVVAKIDKTLIANIHRHQRRFCNDLVSGLVGIGIYAIDRRRAPINHKLLSAVVAALLSRPPFSMDRQNRSGSLHIRCVIEPGTDLGIAHGVSGTLAFLSMVVRLFPNEDIFQCATHTLGRALGAEEQAQGASLFHYVARGKGQSRLAWCYGDLSVAVALASAANALGNADLAEKARLVAHHSCMRRTGAETAVVDHYVCHGSSGLAYVYALLAESLASKLLASTSNYWRQIALTAGTATPEADKSILGSEIGARLAVAACGNPDFRTWDYCLLLGALKRSATE